MTTGHSSIRNTSVNYGGAQPLQGFDVGVWVYDIGRKKDVLLGQFTSILIRMRIGTEPYMGAGSRQALLLDGEFLTGFDLEKGLLSSDVLQETFGFRVFNRHNVYLRSPRFNITFGLDPVDWSALDEPGMDLHTYIKRYPAGKIILTDCKMNELLIAATAGKGVSATKWTGLSEGVMTEVATLKTLQEKYPDRTANEYDETGRPIDISKVRTFSFNTYADQASTYSPLFEPSRRQENAFSFLQSVLTYSELIAERQRLMLISYVPGVKEAIDAITQLIDSIFGGQSNATPSFALPAEPNPDADVKSFESAQSITADRGRAWVLSEIRKADEALRDPLLSEGDKANLSNHREKLAQIIDLLGGANVSFSVNQPITPASISSQLAEQRSYATDDEKAVIDRQISVLGKVAKKLEEWVPSSKVGDPLKSNELEQ